MSRGPQAKTATAILALILLYAAVVNGWFIAVDERPCNINELSHVMGGIDFLNIAGDRAGLFPAYLEAFSGYPPIGVVATAAYAVFGRYHESALVTQLLFHLLLLVGMYLLGARLADRQAGLFATWLLAISPATVEVARQYLLEGPLTAFSVWTAYFLVASDHFRNRRAAVAAGVCAGLAALSKQPFFLFLLGPALYVLPGWIKAIRQQPKTTAKTPWWKLWWGVLAGLFVGWFIYGRNATAIENWFAAYPDYQLPYGIIFALLTAALFTGIVRFLAGPNRPSSNGLAALLIAVAIASIWYFPRGLLSFIDYLNQMRMNVERAGMSPATLIDFYRGYLADFYLTRHVWMTLAITLAGLSPLVLLRGKLSRRLDMRYILPPKNALLFALLWLMVPAVSFLFISIQNELNSVPITPALALLPALFFSRPARAYSAATRKLIADGDAPADARLWRGITIGFQGLIAGLLVIGGVLLVTPWPDGKGGYADLPGALDRRSLVETWFSRKLVPIGYMTPRPASWHERDIAHALFDNLPEGATEPPRVLAMDVEFYFSWNTFWYMAHLMDKRVQIRTPWYEDADILDPASSDYVFTYEGILYRTAYDEVYHAEKIRNDYQSYQNLLAGYSYLQKQPPELMETYREAGRFPLPDGTTAVVLRRR